MTQKFTFATREEGFDNHIEQSIRGYNNLIDDVINLSQYFVENNTNVYDIGCSTGKMMKAMIEQNKFAPKASYIGVEIEEDFYPAYDEDERTFSNLTYIRNDVRAASFINASLITSIFTLQFMPERDRLQTIGDIYEGLNEGGGFIFAEKVRSESSKIHEMRTFTYYDFKKLHFDYDDIMTKEKTLRSMMKPGTKESLIEMCYSIGFSSVDTFWQNHSFIGFIAIK